MQTGVLSMAWREKRQAASRGVILLEFVSEYLFVLGE